MKLSSFLHFAGFGIKTVLFRKKEPILGTVIVTDKCNLKCKHCSVNNITAVVHPYEQIRREMQQLYDMGIRILFFCGGETFLWRDGERTLRDLVVEAKEMGFLIVNVVTNGTFPIDLPEADLILLSLDGDGSVIMQSVAIPTTPSWRILNMPPPITSASTWPSTRSTRMLWSMFALRPEIPKMSGQYPLISTRPIRTPESWLSPERKKPIAAMSSQG